MPVFDRRVKARVPEGLAEDIEGNGARIEGMDEVTITFSRKDYDALIEMLGCLHDESASDGDGYLDEWDSPELEHIKEIIRAAGSDKV